MRSIRRPRWTANAGNQPGGWGRCSASPTSQSPPTLRAHNQRVVGPHLQTEENQLGHQQRDDQVHADAENKTHRTQTPRPTACSPMRPRGSPPPGHTPLLQTPLPAPIDAIQAAASAPATPPPSPPHRATRPTTAAAETPPVRKETQIPMLRPRPKTSEPASRGK